MIVIYLIIILFLFSILPILSLFPAEINNTYINENKQICENYTVSHQTYDGARSAYAIKHQLVSPTLLPLAQCKSSKYASYQYMTNPNREGYSPFVNTVAYFVKNIMTLRNLPLTFSILVSIRKNPKRKGNFLKSAMVHAKPENSHATICELIQKEIQHVRQKKYIIDQVTLLDMLMRQLQSEFIFNSWKDLTTIKKKNGDVLTLQEYEMSEEEFERVKVKNRFFPPKLLFMTYSKNRNQFILRSVIDIHTFI